MGTGILQTSMLGNYSGSCQVMETDEVSNPRVCVCVRERGHKLEGSAAEWRQMDRIVLSTRMTSTVSMAARPLIFLCVCHEPH